MSVSGEGGGSARVPAPICTFLNLKIVFKPLC